MDLCNGNCFILTTKKKTYTNKAEIIFMKKKLSDLYCYKKQGQWDDLMETEGESIPFYMWKFHL